MFNVLLATGNESIDKVLRQGFKQYDNIEILPNPVYFREGLNDSIDRVEPDVVILSDYLDGSSLTQKNLIRSVRKRHPEVKLVYMTKDNNIFDLQRFLFALSVFDIIPIHPRIDLKELTYMIEVGKEWKDIAHLIDDLDPSEQFKIDEEVFYSKSASSDDFEYQPLGTTMKEKSNKDFVDIASFWSPRAQSGSTMLATNSALLFGQNEKVLLVDLNFNNPNVNLHYSTNVDPNNNIAALLEDVENGRLRNLGEIKNYIMLHNQVTSIHMIPGFILKNEIPSKEVVDKTLSYILTFARKAGYSTILLDVEPGLSYDISLSALKASTKVIMPILETPGSIISLQKFFDTELGNFYLNLLDINKVYPIINQSINTEASSKINQLVSSILNRKIYAQVPRSAEIFNNISEGKPILRQQPSPHILRELIKTANCISDSFVVPELNVKRKSIFKK